MHDSPYIDVQRNREDLDDHGSARRPRLGRRPRHVQPPDRPAARGDRLPGRRARRRRRASPRAQRGLRVAPRHRATTPGRSARSSDALLLNTVGARPASRSTPPRAACASARRRAGRTSTPRLSELGLAALHGSSPDVGIVGYSLGGGIGWLARKHGMQTNAVTAIELVTADGRLVRTDPEHEPELFWALRGGNGNFGVVTAIEFEVLPVRELYAGALFFPVEQTADVLHAWTELLPAPARGAHVVGQRPALPAAAGAPRGDPRALVRDRHGGVPRLRGRGARAAAAAARAAARRSTRSRCSRRSALSELAMDPRDPLPFRIRARADRRAAGERDRGHRADRRPRLVAHDGAAPPHGRRPRPPRARRGRARDAARRDLRVRPRRRPRRRPPSRRSVAELDALSAAVAPQRVGDYPNFVEDPADASGFFDPATWERLRRVKALYDPDDLFKGNHHIPPAWARAEAA